MRAIARILTAVLLSSLGVTLHASTYGSVEPIANAAVIDTSALSARPLRLREAFANRLFECGIVDRVVDALASTGTIKTIDSLNTHFAVGAGGFAGHTNPSFVYTVIDGGPNAASLDDIKVLTDSLGYVMSQASAFLLAADNPSSFDFPANFVVLNFKTPPPLARSAELFKTVGRIDRELFATGARLPCSGSSTRRSSGERRRCSREAPPFPATTGRWTPVERNTSHEFRGGVIRS